MLTFDIWPTVPSPELSRPGSVDAFAYGVLRNPGRWHITRDDNPRNPLWRFELSIAGDGFSYSVVEGGDELRDVAYLATMGYTLLDWPSLTRSLEYFPDRWRYHAAGHKAWYFGHAELPIRYRAEGFDVEMLLMGLKHKRDQAMEEQLLIERSNYPRYDSFHGTWYDSFHTTG